MELTATEPETTVHILAFAYAVGCIFVAAIVRGYSGFGFSMLAITSLSLLLPPVQIVPSIFLMELVASLHLLPGAWPEIHWRALSWLVVGCCLGTPLGVYALAHAPPAPMTLALAVFVLASAILLGRGYEMQRMPGRAFTVAAGTASGLCNGGFGMGGPPVILFFFSSPAGVAAGRASLIAFFLLTDIVALGWQGWSGLITITTVWRAALFLPPLVAGVWLGNRSFKQADQSVVRRWILRLLMLLALLSGARALLQLI